MTGLLTQFTDVDGMGLEVAQGLIVSEAFYWNENDATRAWSRRFAARMGGRMPTANQAGVYSSVLAYLRAVRATGTIEGTAIMAHLQGAPIDDALFGRVTLRADGGRFMPCMFTGSNDRTNRRGAMITTSQSRRFPRSRHSVRSPMAGARW